jgi:RNA polymerase sigma-70 factor (ECF subfamily)
MTAPEPRSTHLQELLDRLRQGDVAVRSQLLLQVRGRLERLAHAMLARFPNVRRWEDTDDVVQQALLRLLRSLEQLQPPSPAALFGLAAEEVRRVLLDLARHYRALNQAHATPHGPSLEQLACAPDSAATGSDHLERWSAFHEAVAQLPAEEREVASLVFYHGWKQVQMAELLQVSLSTVQRRWQAACLRLNELLRGAIPDV